VYGEGRAQHEEAESLVDRTARAAGTGGTDAQRADLEAASRAGSGEGGAPRSRKQRRAMAAREAKQSKSEPEGGADAPAGTAAPGRAATGGGKKAYKSRRKRSR
jgi:hypothetical protein